MRLIRFVVCLALGESVTAAEDLFSLDIEQLAQIRLNTSVATLYALPQRESPAVLTVISAEEIRQLHARDLVDVFQRVPGFQITQDIAATTFSVRGLYAFEGRALVMVDGAPLNELLFGGYPIANDFPIHLIKRIEIIRGPGSVIYGGSAETAVINIVLDNATGTDTYARYGRLPTTVGHQDIALRFSHHLDEWQWSGLLFAGDARRSDADYRYFQQRPAFTHNEQSADIDTEVFLFNVRHEDVLSLQIVRHYLRNNVVTGFAVPVSTPPDQIDDAMAAGIASHLAPANFSNTSVTADGLLWHDAQAQWRWSAGWRENRPFERPRRDDVQVRRQQLGTQFENAIAQWHWLIGGEWVRDQALMLRTRDEAQRDPNLGLRETPNDDLHEAIAIHSGSLFGSIMWRNEALRLFAGARIDEHDLYDTQLSPRIGLTWHQPSLYFKALISHAFHAPLTANTAFSRFGYDPDKPHRSPVAPERAKVYEIELGYVINDAWFVSANLFYQHLYDVIEFRYNVAADDLFSDNGGEYGSYGAEFEVRWQQSHWTGLFTLAYAAPKLFHDDNPDSYQAYPYGGDTYLALHEPKEWLALSDWKAFAHVNYRVDERWSWQLNITYLSEKNASVATPFGQTGTLPAQTLFDLGMWYDTNTWRLGLSVHDLSNERLNVASPFVDSGYDTLRYKGREWSLDWFMRW